MNLKAWRKREKLTQGELAEKLEIIENTYQAYESGRISTPPDIQLKIKKLGFRGEFPEQEAAPPTTKDIESLREEIRTQVKWAREEIRKENKALAADLQEALKRLAELQGNQQAASP